ncbi:MAG: 1,4-dihydroxy-2-naphthoate octaprenyltransferase [Bacteroidales bacterium]|nr:1,4-dihydroxy-2-naphthoate octaprenyltransferase [Candidatus Colimorpha onthohippi]
MTSKQKIKALIRSARLRTLPLSLAGVCCGMLLARNSYHCHDLHAALLTLLLCLTTIGLQLLSNLSNELGDYRNGTDRADREGPSYGMASGGLTEQDLQRAVRYMAVLTAITGLGMIVMACNTLFSWKALVLVLLGGCAIWASLHYTLGDNPYGYRGWGDLFVFIFFGLVAVGGAYYVVSGTLPIRVLLPGAAIGFFSIGVLNVNNIRDMASDRATRTTIPIRIGLHRARLYHAALIACGWVALVAYSCLYASAGLLPWLYLITTPCYINHTIGVFRRQNRALDPMLPLLVMSTFATALLFALLQ